MKIGEKILSQNWGFLQNLVHNWRISSDDILTRYVLSHLQNCNRYFFSAFFLNILHIEYFMMDSKIALKIAIFWDAFPLILPIPPTLAVITKIDETLSFVCFLNLLTVILLYFLNIFLNEPNMMTNQDSGEELKQWGGQI